MVLGSHKGQYSMIYGYLGEIRTSNPGSTTILMLDNRVFLRMYICLHACKEGYKAGCRSVLSIDGCHLKGYYGGTFLAAVSVDANDHIYPIAYAVVEAETESSWNWFLSLLEADLGIGSSHNITIVSDKQKGLKEAILEVFSAAEHRNCVRHLYSNFKNQQDHAQWSKSHFSPRSKSAMLLSNLFECFNKMILEARDKPILTLMEMVKRATTLSAPHVMPTSSSPPVMSTTSASPHVMVTSLSPPVMPTTSASSQISPFVFIPTPGNVMRVRWMQSSQEYINGGQHLSQSSTITQNSQEENNPSVPLKKPRMV
ncbi:hypothetical protein V6N13_027603 [Hibiscus sabdariffa]